MTKDELKIYIGLHRVTNYIDQESSKSYKKEGLTTGQYAVLEVLYHKGDLSVGQVQEKILSSTGTMPVIIRNLKKRGLIEDFSDENDKRRVILSITEAGKELMEKIYPENEAKIIELMKPWTAREKQTLVRLLKKYGEKMDKD